MKPGNKLIVALDVNNLRRAEGLIDSLYPLVKIFKIGSQLFTACGPRAIELAHSRKAKVFLDLKFCDIPSTVAKAAIEATRLGVFMFNLHVLGGLEMMQKASEASNREAGRWKKKRPIILGVTILTSLKQRDLTNLGINRNLKDQVGSLAKLAKKAGLDGVVAAGEEIEAIRKSCGKNFLVVTPGIRPKGKRWQDQKRIMSPEQAILKGADYMVIGRPVIEAKAPLKVVEGILKDIQ